MTEYEKQEFYRLCGFKPPESAEVDDIFSTLFGGAAEDKSSSKRS